MDPLIDVALSTWTWEPQLLLLVVVASLVYWRGWTVLRRTNPRQFDAARLTCFLSGLAVAVVALISPLDALGELRLSLHMLQHLLLMMVAPPLLWLGAPALPLLRGLPTYIQREWVGPFLRPGPVQTFLHGLTHPAVCWLLPITAVWLWHLPSLYELALANPTWHKAEHLTFLAAGMLFWWPVIQPYPSHARWSRWAMIPYLLLADVQNTVFSAIFCFSPSVIYAHYAALPHFGQSDPLTDQALAGAIMWIPGSILFLAPVAWLLLQLLGRSPAQVTAHVAPIGLASSLARKTTSRRKLDLLRLPLLGQAIRWPHSRTVVQVCMLLLAVAIVIDGFAGPQLAPTNLAGVLPWTHWRGFTVLGLLAVGNLFCFACPFTLPRKLAARWLPIGRVWPSWLRTKWLAVALVVLYLGCYEVFSLWSSPWWTAWLVLGYFAAAFVVDALFRGSSFCKYVCPIGQFHFVQSLVSPFEIRPREPVACQSCTSHACLHGNEQQTGCQLNLFVPQKQGNLDCTLCLDCVRACPVDNIGLLPVLPAAELSRDVPRSGVGRWSRRHDLAALVVVLTFGAFANAAGMIAPVLDWQDRLALRLDVPVPLVVAGVFTAEVLLLPAVVLLGAFAVSRLFARDRRPWQESLARYIMCLVPLGAAMWAVHFAFHLATSALTVWPVTQRAAADLQIAGLGTPDWQCGCCAVPPTWLLQAEMFCLGLGLLLSLHAAYRVSGDDSHDDGQNMLTMRRAGALLPWSVVMLAFYIIGLWIIFQPMQMRGTMLTVGAG